MGRPPILRKIIRHRVVDGQQHPVTVFDSIVEDVRASAYIEAAAARANVHKSQVFLWLKTGAALSAAIIANKTTRDELTEHERDCLDFADAVDQARAEYALRGELALEQLAQPREVVVETTTTRQTPDGVETTVTRRVEHELPDGPTVRWRLERAFPARYGRRVVVEGTGEGGAIPIEARAAGLAQGARRFIETAAIEDDDQEDEDAQRQQGDGEDEVEDAAPRAPREEPGNGDVAPA